MFEGGKLQLVQWDQDCSMPGKLGSALSWPVQASWPAIPECPLDQVAWICLILVRRGKCPPRGFVGRALLCNATPRGTAVADREGRAT